MRKTSMANSTNKPENASEPVAPKLVKESTQVAPTMELEAPKGGLDLFSMFQDKEFDEIPQLEVDNSANVREEEKFEFFFEQHQLGSGDEDDSPFDYELDFQIKEHTWSYQNELSKLDLLSDQFFMTEGHSIPDRIVSQYEIANNNEDEGCEIPEPVSNVQIPQPVEIDPSVDRIEESKSPQSQGSLSVDNEKLEKLVHYLSKTRGVNQTAISSDIVELTIEKGQKYVAKKLNIPYRRYKSILNKSGIRTNAGRKVKTPELESQLITSAEKSMFRGEILTRKVINERAKDILEDLVKEGKTGLSGFRLSKGWLDKFLKRNQHIRNYLTSQKGKKY